MRTIEIPAPNKWASEGWRQVSEDVFDGTRVLLRQTDEGVVTELAFVPLDASTGTSVRMECGPVAKLADDLRRAGRRAQDRLRELNGTPEQQLPWDGLR